MALSVDQPRELFPHGSSGQSLVARRAAKDAANRGTL
jgi:hypothetical protein